MRIPQLQPLSVRNKTIMFTGGLNEEAAKLQLKPGELQDVLNYHEIAGPYSGYASLEGYERYDGQEAPSDVALDTAAAWANTTVYTEFDAGLTYSSIVTHGDYTFKCILDHTASTGANEPDSTTPGSNTWWELIDATADLEEIDVNREYTRTAILTVGNGASSGNCRGVAYWQQTVLAFRDNLLATAMEMWIDSPSGWTKTGIAGDNDFLPGGSVQSIKYKFADYNNGDEVLVIVDGVSYPRTWDGTTLTKVNHANLPDPVTEAAPFLCGTYNNRLFLAYRDGYMFFSAIDAPTDFDNITKSAGYLYFGDEITNIVEAPGNVLVVVCKNKITIIKGNDYDEELLEWVPQVEQFSKSSGGFLDTAQRFMGDIYYADEEGVTNMQSTDTYGDFNTGVVSNKVQKTFLRYKDLISASLIERHFNQYRLYFSNGVVLYFTFHKSRLKGATKGIYPQAVLSVSFGEDTNGNIRKFFTSNDGYVYEMDSGTSFDGVVINTRMITSYHHYGYTRDWKNFQSVLLEIEALSDITISVRPYYDYNETSMPNTAGQDVDIEGPAGIWGESEWGTMVYGAGSNEREMAYLFGYGTNMALEFKTSSKYAIAHIMQNMTVDYSVNGRKL